MNDQREAPSGAGEQGEQITVTLPEPLVLQLRALVELEGASVDEVVARALEREISMAAFAVRHAAMIRDEE